MTESAGGAEPVGIVLVSHSDRLAAGLGDLVRQIVGDRVPVELAAGTVEGEIGTSDLLVQAAVHRANRGSGAVVLADLGSAVLTVLDVLAESSYDDVVLADAPIVEGAIAAAVIAGTGADLPAVVAAAEESRESRKLS